MKKLRQLILISLIGALLSITAYAADPVSMALRQGIIQGYYYTETIADGATGKNVKIPPMGLNSAGITCTIIAGANTGKFQFTTSSDAAVQADTATWIDFPDVDVTGTESKTIGSQVTGIRGVSASGEIKIEIVY